MSDSNTTTTTQNLVYPARESSLESEKSLLLQLKVSSGFVESLSNVTSKITPQIQFLSNTEAKIFIDDEEYSVRFTDIDHTEAFSFCERTNMMNFFGIISGRYKVVAGISAIKKPAMKVISDSSKVEVINSIPSGPFLKSENFNKIQTPGRKILHHSSKNIKLTKLKSPINLATSRMVVNRRKVSTPWIVCRRISLQFSVKDLKNFFSGLNFVSFYIEAEFNKTETPNFGDVFIEFNRKEGAELALLRSGEKTTGSNSQTIDVDEISEEHSVWIKSIGVWVDGSTPFIDRLKTLQTCIPLEYLSFNSEKVLSHWHPFTKSMTHFHLKTQSSNKGKKTTTLPIPTLSLNVKDRFVHMPNNILLDEIFLNDFIFSSPPTIASVHSEFGASGTSSREVDPYIDEVVHILRCIIPLRDRYFLLANSSSVLESISDVINKNGSSFEYENEKYVMAQKHLSGWIHIFRIILAELWSLKHTYSMLESG